MRAGSRGNTWPYGRRGAFERRLRSAASDWFASHHFSVSARMGYCLATHEDWPKNIIDPEVVDLVNAQIAISRDAEKPFPLHRYVHHGLSSQAMLFNHIGPLIIRNDLAPLETAMSKAGVKWPVNGRVSTFEFEDRSVFNELQGQPTSIDLVVGDPSEPGAIFIESKLVENGFGGCSLFEDGDCNGENPSENFGSCYLHHIGRTYLPLLEKHGFLSGGLATDAICPLANQYQFYRELILAMERGGTFVLLADDRSPVFRSRGTPDRGLWPLLSRLVPATAQSSMAYVSIQSVVQAIEASRNHSWISEFKRKYGID